MRTCPKGTNIDLCRNRDMYNDTNNEAVIIMYYEEGFCPACELIGPLDTPTSCFICNEELCDELPDQSIIDEVGKEFDPSKYHINCYYFSIVKLPNSATNHDSNSP